MTDKMTGGEAMARQLVEEGVTHLFGIPGVQLDYATNGLSKVTDRLRFVPTRHEQTATYAADGYARTTGRVGVGLVVPGPGVLNAGAGLVTSWSVCSKVLLIAGQLPTRGLGKGLGMVHEIPDQSGILRTLSRGAELVTDPDRVPGAIRHAMARLAEGPGPMVVELPPDILSGLTAAELEAVTPAVAAPAGDPALLDDAAARLGAARRPMLVAGGGVVAGEAYQELLALARRLGAPVTTTANGRGAVDDRDPLALLPVAGRDVMADADVVLLVGSRGLTQRGRAFTVAEGATLIHLTLEEKDFGPPRSADVAIAADARAGLAALFQRLDGADRPCWASTEQLAAARAREQASLARLEPQWSYCQALRRAIPDDGILVNELTQVGYVSMVGYPVHHPRSYLWPGFQGTLGYGYPTAIGAKVGNPDRAVVSITGDGGFGYGLAELATAVQERLGVVVVVFSDGAYGNVRRMHQAQFDGVSVGTQLTNPDWVALARSFGADGEQVNDATQLEVALRRAIEADRPALIEVPMPPTPDPWALILG
ncbi:MAG: thiamine pyrophosphate-binding protein [Acidimicrobiales bacterium]|nr:thiamine pyrophosphate-binding protein [Acidimicrobiales bacterium]